MTAATLTHLPFAAGGAVLASAGQLAAWTLSRYMRAPLANTAILAMVATSAMAASNALYFQQHAHPAPLFAPEVQQAAEQAPVLAPRPVTPAVRARPVQVIPPLPEVETTGSVTRVPDEVIGNSEVFELQRKLVLMELFQGEVDGYYGPQTAGAIRRFEKRMGLPETGELTPEIIEAVRAAPAFSIAPRDDILRAPSAPANAVQSESADPAATLSPPRPAYAPLPAPEPLPLAVAPTATPPATTGRSAQSAPHRELPETPQEAFNIAVETAGDAIDTIIAGVQSVTADGPRRSATTSQHVSSNAATGRQAPTRVAAVTATPTPSVAREPSVAATPAAETRPEQVMPEFSATDPAIVASVQRGLASLGFLHGPVDGVAGEATAKAIRNFEVYFNYEVTGRITPGLLDLLVRNGASI